MTDGPIRCGVIGTGRMGRHHVRNYSEIPGVELVGVVDSDPERARDMVEQFGGTAMSSVEELIQAGVEAVSVATPTIHHLESVEPLLRNNVACLVEKPLAPDASEAEHIASIAAETGTLLQVGHIVRYDPVMRAIRGIEGMRPRFIEVHRISPMTFRSVDVGVVLDMMIHDLDALLMLMGSEPEEVHANAVCVVGEAEDVCNARLVFPPREDDDVRCVCNVTASRLALKTERKFRIISEDMYVSADFVECSGTVVRKTANAEKLEEVRSQLRDGMDLSSVDYLDLINIDPLEVSPGEPLRLQIDDFLDCLRHGRKPLVDADAGFAAVRTAERIVEAAREAGARMV